MGSTDELERAAASMVRALRPGGALVIELWWFPENYLGGYVTGAIAESEGRVIVAIQRVSGAVRRLRCRG